MRVMRLVGLLLVAVVAMSFVVESSALAAESPNPLFVPASNQTVTAKGGASTLKSQGIEISCAENQVVSGNVSNGLLIGNIVIHYLKCTVPKGEAANGCEASSTGAPAGLILTTTLHAVLGIELPANRTVAVFLPVSGNRFTTFVPSEKEGKVCNLESQVTGTVAGLIEPVGVTTTAFRVLVGGPGVLVHLTHSLGLLTTKLVALGGTATLEQSDEGTYGVTTEVT